MIMNKFLPSNRTLMRCIAISCVNAVVNCIMNLPMHSKCKTQMTILYILPGMTMLKMASKISNKYVQDKKEIRDSTTV